MVSKQSGWQFDRKPSGLKQDQFASQYVIQRSSETVREWWTGTAWSDDLNRARCYDEKPDVSVETEDEMAKALMLKEVDDSFSGTPET